MGGNTDANNLVVFDIDPYHKAKFTAKSFSYTFKCNRAGLAVKFTHKETPLNISVLDFEPVNDGIIGCTFKYCLNCRSFNKFKLLIFDLSSRSIPETGKQSAR